MVSKWGTNGEFFYTTENKSSKRNIYISYIPSNLSASGMGSTDGYYNYAKIRGYINSSSNMIYIKDPSTGVVTTNELSGHEFKFNYS